ncbi:MAG: 50S ribosomal protein L35 [Candidatus Gastranaerophilales bacterium]|nr:50S ribosomal protein L35 [Candidatus Gastranaerophilales bacterium]
MPKMKTHRAGAKRYKVTASGKILHRQSGTKHLLQHKSADRKRRIGGMVEVSATHKKLVSKELPYMRFSR